MIRLHTLGVLDLRGPDGAELGAVLQAAQAPRAAGLPRDRLAPPIPPPRLSPRALLAGSGRRARASRIAARALFPARRAGRRHRDGTGR